jgi:hypothetical protein
MAVRDARTNKARTIPQLITEDEDERALWNMGAEQKQRKTQLASMSLERQPPNQEETAVSTLAILPSQAGNGRMTLWVIVTSSYMDATPGAPE